MSPDSVKAHVILHDTIRNAGIAWQRDMMATTDLSSMQTLKIAIDVMISQVCQLSIGLYTEQQIHDRIEAFTKSHQLLNAPTSGAVN